MIYTFTLLFLVILTIKLVLLYQNYSSTQKNFLLFCKQWNLTIAHTFRFTNPKIPEIIHENWKINWLKHGKGRSFNHVLKIFFNFQEKIPDVKIASKNIFSKLGEKDTWIEIDENLFCNSQILKNYPDLWTQIRKTQKDYGWGVLEIKNQQAFYTILAEPSETKAWQHLTQILKILIQLDLIYARN